jgi:hypothetical protein
MKFKRFLNDNNNLFESVFEKYYINGFFGNIDKQVIKEQQISWCVKICSLIESKDINSLVDCLESRDAKTSREWVSKIISNDILVDSRQLINDKLTAIFEDEGKFDKVLSVAGNLAGDALVIGSLLSKAVKGLGLPIPSIRNAYNTYMKLISLGTDEFKLEDPDQNPESIRFKITKKVEREAKTDPNLKNKTKEELQALINTRVKSTLTRYRNQLDPERSLKGSLSFGSKTQNTPTGKIFQLAVGYDHGDFLGFLLNVIKTKDKDIEITLTEIKDRDKLDSIIKTMDRNALGYYKNISKIKDGNKIIFINRKDEKDNIVLEIDCSPKTGKCIVRTERGTVLDTEKM